MVGHTGHPVQHVYACDFRWWRHHCGDVARDFDGTCWTQDQQWFDKDGKPLQDPAAWGIRQLKSVNKDGLSTTPGVIHTGRNSGYQAINLALLRLIETDRLPGIIILLGYDMSVDGKLRHWFGDHPKHFAGGMDYKHFVANYRTIEPEKYQLEIWNCSRRTALDCFPRLPLEEAIRRLQ